VALIDATIEGETPLTEQDLQALKLPFVKTRAQLSAVDHDGGDESKLRISFRADQIALDRLSAV
jgi:hypothetical protein